MGWASQDALTNDLTVNGKTDGFIYQKNFVAAGLAGHWHHLINSAGSPPAATFGGTELTFTPTDDTWSEGALQHGGDKGAETKHLIACGGSLVAAAGAPWFCLPIDLVGYVKLTGTNVSAVGAKTVTMTPISNTAAKVDRYADGVGLRMFVGAMATMGANAPTLQVTYTNSSAVAGRVTTAGCVSTASATNSTILNSGNAANKYGPFLPLQGNDVGVQDIQSLTWGGTAHASGSVIIGLCKPLVSLPIPVPATGLFNLFDYVNTIPSFPRIKDGANIQFLIFNTGATTSGGTFYAGGQFAWGA
jgi:hypothetical protein